MVYMELFIVKCIVCCAFFFVFFFVSIKGTTTKYSSFWKEQFMTLGNIAFTWYIHSKSGMSFRKSKSEPHCTLYCSLSNEICHQLVHGCRFVAFNQLYLQQIQSTSSKTEGQYFSLEGWQPRMYGFPWEMIGKAK